MSRAQGFAYMDEKGRISVKSVSETREGAVVNAIAALTDGRVFPLSHWTQGEIDAAYMQATGGKGSIIAVKIDLLGTTAP